MRAFTVSVMETRTIAVTLTAENEAQAHQIVKDLAENDPCFLDLDNDTAFENFNVHGALKMMVVQEQEQLNSLEVGEPQEITVQDAIDLCEEVCVWTGDPECRQTFQGFIDFESLDDDIDDDYAEEGDFPGDEE